MVAFVLPSCSSCRSSRVTQKLLEARPGLVEFFFVPTTVSVPINA